MRKHLYLIVSHPDDQIEGTVEVTDRPRQRAQKNKRLQVDKRNVKTDESYVETVVGMGYADFDGEEDYEERGARVIREKMGEINNQHLEAVGADPAQFGGFEEGGDGQ